MALVGEILSSREVQRRELAESFELFWKLYPRRDGKGAVRDKWKRMLPEQRRAALLAVVPFSQIWEVADASRIRFIPLPMTWLNQCRYEDDPKAWMRQAAGDDADAQRTIVKQLREGERKSVREEHKAWIARLYSEVGVTPPTPPSPEARP